MDPLLIEQIETLAKSDVKISRKDLTDGIAYFKS